MTQNKQHYLLNRADEASNLLKKHIDQDHVVRIISHNDSDGISAAGIMCNAISQQKGKFHVTIVPRLRESFLKKIQNEKYKLFVFCDMGSASLDSISRLNGEVIIADHHQTTSPDNEEDEKIVHINPHLFGLDGTRDISASGVSYLVVRQLQTKSLADLALVGAYGDMQCADNIIGINKMIVDDGLKAGVLEVHDELKISYKNEEPLYKSLAYTFNPALEGISGDMEGSMEFLERIGLSYGIKFNDLGDEERDILKEALIGKNPKIFGTVYSIPQEIPTLRNVEDYSNILDACGKNKKHGIGLSICLGERDDNVNEALQFLKKYQDNLIKGLEWIKKEGSISLDNIQYIYTEDKMRKSIMGTLSTAGLELQILNPEKPVLAISRMDNLIKVSARTSSDLINKGVNLGYALGEASKSFNGAGGGHNIAAGAVVPYKDMGNFTNIVDEIVGKQVEKALKIE
ncbi:MAG: DHH family phosphoesterase [Euryarchaeota archaeon]|nr:DHH family phosphoesterase [Euryarchaeota archaeon]